jgi:hypothetical protein
MNWQPEGWQPVGWQPDDWQPEAGAFATAIVSGTLLGSNEKNVVNGGRTTDIDLTNTTWVAAGATFNAVRQDIIDGNSATDDEIFGWNGEVRDNEVVESVERISDSRVLITWTAAAGYDIEQNELINVTVPASAVVGGIAIEATPGAAIRALTGMQPVNGRKPHKKRISVRSASFALSGPEQPYPVYPFSRRQFFERPNHNPFKGL